jgi:hypothetical protein
MFRRSAGEGHNGFAELTPDEYNNQGLTEFSGRSLIPVGIEAINDRFGELTVNTKKLDIRSNETLPSQNLLDLLAKMEAKEAMASKNKTDPLLDSIRRKLFQEREDKIKELSDNNQDLHLYPFL